RQSVAPGRRAFQQVNGNSFRKDPIVFESCMVEESQHPFGDSRRTAATAYIVPVTGAGSFRGARNHNCRCALAYVLPPAFVTGFTIELKKQATCSRRTVTPAQVKEIAAVNLIVGDKSAVSSILARYALQIASGAVGRLQVFESPLRGKKLSQKVTH